MIAFTDRTNAGDVWLLPLDGSASASQATHVFDYLDQQFDLPAQERVEWKGADGVTVEGLLSYPLGYQQGRRYPLVVQSHGGMANADEVSFGAWSLHPDPRRQGYAVLKTNDAAAEGMATRSSAT